MSDKPLSFDVVEIMEMIPHRYPFLLVDKVTECVPGVFSRGYKCLTINEAFFQGHFPGNPIMPGVLQIEAIAQVGASAMMTLPQYKDKLIVFAGIDNARFKSIVRPGDRLDMVLEVTKVKGNVIKASGKAYVGDKLTVSADMLFSAI